MSFGATSWNPSSPVCAANSCRRLVAQSLAANLVRNYTAHGQAEVYERGGLPAFKLRLVTFHLAATLLSA